MALFQVVSEGLTPRLMFKATLTGAGDKVPRPRAAPGLDRPAVVIAAYGDPCRHALLRATLTIMATLSWKKVRAGVYAAPSALGLYSIDGNNAGRNRWTVTYPDNDYGMTDSLSEAKAWAKSHASARTHR